jgi:hypothetical protein
LLDVDAAAREAASETGMEVLAQTGRSLPQHGGRASYPIHGCGRRCSAILISGP